MNTPNTLTRPADLSAEIELRQRIELGVLELISNLQKGLTPANDSDVNALVALLIETIEVRKVAEKNEKRLKDELKRFIPPNGILLMPAGLVSLSKITRTDLDKDLLTKEMGPNFVEKYSKSSTYERIDIKKGAV